MAPIDWFTFLTFGALLISFIVVADLRNAMVDLLKMIADELKRVIK